MTAIRPGALDPLNPALAGLLKVNPGALEAVLLRSFDGKRESEAALRRLCEILGIELSQFPRLEDMPADLWERIGRACADAQRRAAIEATEKTI
jgi:hypothetical protein